MIPEKWLQISNGLFVLTRCNCTELGRAFLNRQLFFFLFGILLSALKRLYGVSTSFFVKILENVLSLTFCCFFNLQLFIFLNSYIFFLKPFAIMFLSILLNRKIFHIINFFIGQFVNKVITSTKETL